MGHSCSYDSGTCGYIRAQAPSTPNKPQPGRSLSAPKVENEPWVYFNCSSFAVALVMPPEGEASLGVQPFVPHAVPHAVGSTGWRCNYSLGPLLGDGISAKVFQGEASTVLPDEEGLGSASASRGGCALPVDCSGCSTNNCNANIASAAMTQCLRQQGRKVAIKRFHRPGTRTYMKELSALRRSGTHPNVLRLLESYQGFGGEDALVLEYCDGSTLYDLYAREHPNGGLPERLVAKLLRQLLLALQHLASCGIEHQDVKPENMMLYNVQVSAFQAELKLGDFGWAAIAPPRGSKVNKAPPTGAGSLWYAPPELNPPVEGINPEPPALDFRGDPVTGLSDMWSAGVVLYLLLIGHNPFNQALKQKTPEAQDQEVLRLVALGSFNRQTAKWLNLFPDAQNLVSTLLRVQPGRRPSATDALQHPFVTHQSVAGGGASPEGYSGSVAPPDGTHGDNSPLPRNSAPPWAAREHRWSQLDGLQRLAWLAVAKAVCEPEVEPAVVQGALDGIEHERKRQKANPQHGANLEVGYLWQLARELSSMPVFQTLQGRGRWPEATRLAFSYLDVDRDGLLSSKDLISHFAGPPTMQTLTDDLKGPAALEARGSTSSDGDNASSLRLASRWIDRWEPRNPQGGFHGISLKTFRDALLASCRKGSDSLFRMFDNSEDDSLVGECEEESAEDCSPRVQDGGMPGLGQWVLGGGDVGGTGGGGALSWRQEGQAMSAGSGKVELPDTALAKRPGM